MAEISKLGRYELRRILGRGAMGVVYEGFDPNLSRRVAVKIILKSDVLDAETERAYSARFIQEAKAVARLNHPNIVQVYDFGVESEVAYLVMEFIQGRELRSFFGANESFEIGESVRIMCELLDALDFAHEAGVIHRDVKPANVMLDAQRRAKLADFGVARIHDSAQRTQADTMVGTPAFMSPEQISGAKVDRRTDIFSAGNILYQLLTGEPPFKGEGAWTVVKAIMQDDPPRPSSIAVSLSPAFDEIVNKALAKKPEERFANAREFAVALRGALNDRQQTPAPVAPKQKAKVERRATEAEVEFWRSIQNSSDPAEFEVYLDEFPDGTYAQLARIKLAKLRELIEAARKEAEENARRKAEERARKEAEERAQREAEEEKERAADRKAHLEAEAVARREAESKARRDAEETARRDAFEKAKRESAEKAKREADEKARQALALARLKQQEAAAKAKAAVDEDATVAIGKPPAPPSEPSVEGRKSLAIPAIIAVVTIAGGVAAYMMLGRKPESVPPAPVAQAPAPVAEKAAPPPKAEVASIDRAAEERIRKETEDRIRREFADKAAADKAIADKAVAAKAAADKLAVDKAAAEKAAADKAALAKTTLDKAAAEKAATEKAATEKMAAEKAAADKAATEKAAVDKAAAQKEAAAKAAAVAAKPGWPSVGDRWIYEARDSAHPDRKFAVTVEVQAVTASSVRDVVKAEGSAAVDSVHKPSAFLTGVAPGVFEFSPYLRAFQEIHAGESWSNVDLARLPFCLQAQSCGARARVTGREHVTVKAGSFDAWKIEVKLNWNSGIMWGARANTGVVTFTYWYVEGLRRVVKYQARAVGSSILGSWSEPDMDMELVSYVPAAAR